MKKSLLIGMTAIASLFATSCQNEIDPVSEGKTSVVSFNVGTFGISSRAFSDGETATKLEYAVYKVENDVLTELTDLTVKGEEALTMENKKKEIELQLTTGNVYAMIFWAAAEGAPYEVDFDKKTMTVDYTTAVSNDENRDAFYAYVEPFTVNGSETKTVELKRPFAQLNIGTNDFAASTKAGYTVTKSYVKVPVYTTLNMVDGSVNDEPETIEFNWANIPSGEIFPVAGSYEYLAMNYLLVDAEKETVDVEFMYTDGQKEKTRKVGSVPVQRNHRTNIYGQLITSDVDINVEIKPEYDGIHNYEPVLVHNVFDLQKALDAVQPGETTTIWLQADIEGDVIEFQKADRNVTIDGRGYKYDGTIMIHNGSNYNTGSLTIKNVKFVPSAASINCIEALENGSQRYSNNITVEDCTFTATGEAINTSVAVQVKATRGVTVKNCTATDMHSLIQAQSCDTGDVKVVGCTVNGKNGVAFKQVKSATVEGNTITAAAYGIRFDGNIDNYGIVVKNNNITAVQPFIVRKMTGKNNTIALESENTLTVSAVSASTDAPAYQIVITNGSDDETYVKPTGTYTLTGADNYLVYPRDYYFPVATWDEFTAALAAGEAKVIFTQNIAYEGASSYNLKKDVVVNLNNKTYTTGNASTTWLNIMGSKVTFKGGIIEGKVYVQKNGSTYSDATFDNVTFGGTITFSSVTQGSLAVQGGNSVYAKKCTFKGKGSTTPNVVSLEATSSGSVIFEDCTFNSFMNRFYANPRSDRAIFKLINCSFNKAAVVETSANWDFVNNMSITGSKSLGVNLYIGKAKADLTDAEKAVLDAYKKNNKGTVYCASVRY